MTTGTKVSIAMATYNGGRHLRAQLDSIANQTRPPDELIIADDGSTDSTLAIIQEFSENANFEVRWSQNKHRLGYSQNFNRALMQTTGNIVFLSDQDDIWFPEKLASITDRLETDTHILLLMNNAELTDENLNPTGLTKLNQIRSAGLSDSDFVMGCCIAMKRDLLELFLPIPDNGVSHDSWLALLADAIGRKKIINTVLQYYRRHATSTIKSVVNTPKPATRLRANIEAIRRVWQGGEVYAAQASRRKALMLDSCERALHRLEGKYTKDLQALIAKIKAELAVLEQRENLRALPRIGRLRPLFNLWRSGCYASKGGYKSALRDLISKS